MVDTAYQVVDPFCAPLVPETKFCHPIRLHRTESLLLNEDGDVQIIEAKDGFVNIYTIAESYDPYKEDSEDDQALRIKVFSIAVVIASVFALM